MPQTTEAIKKELMQRLTAMDPTAILLIRRLERIGHKTGDDKLTGYAYYRYAYYYYFTNQNFQLFRKYLKLAIRYLIRCGDREFLASTYNLVAYDAQDHGCYDLAYAYFRLAVSASEPLGGISLPGLILANAGRLMTELGDAKEGRRQIRVAIGKLAPITNMHVYHYNMIITYADEALSSFVLEDKKGVSRTIRKIEEHFRKAKSDEKRLSLTYRLLPPLYQAVLTGDEAGMRALFGKLYRFWRRQPEDNSTGLIYEVECVFTALLERGFIRQAGRLLKETASMERNENLTIAIRHYMMQHTYYVRTNNLKKQQESLRAWHELQKKRNADQIRVHRYAMAFLDMLGDIAAEHASARKEQIQLKEQAVTDALTGLPNRAKMNRVLAGMFEQAKANGQLFAIGIMDIDRFKRFNDSYGHQTGDACLAGIGAVLNASMKESHIFCARYGGDEFVICFRDCTKKEILDTAGEIAAAMSGIRLKAGRKKVNEDVLLSHGICAGIPGEGQKLWDYLSMADDALYRMKKTQAGGYCLVNAAGKP